jgi:DNA sulfur modification protein DndD
VLEIGGQNMNSAESYPLVMDAPLSAFDKTRIKNICDVIPGIAEQVIIFIKDTDGEIAKNYMSEKIGASYRIHMHGHIDSRIEKEA